MAKDDFCMTQQYLKRVWYLLGTLQCYGRIRQFELDSILRQRVHLSTPYNVGNPFPQISYAQKLMLFVLSFLLFDIH
jgi:hypothetical protein